MKTIKNIGWLGALAGLSVFVCVGCSTLDRAYRKEVTWTNAPMVQVGSDFYEDLTAASFEKILDEFAAGKTPKPGPQIDRQLSEPVGGATTLKDPSLYKRVATE